MVTWANNTILYHWNFLRVEVKCSHQNRKKIRWGYGNFNWLDGGNPSTM